VESILSNMIKVDGGSYMMGASDVPQNWFYRTFFGDDYEKELPVHEVSISSFIIGRFMVTIDEWETVMGIIPQKAMKYFMNIELNSKKKYPIHHITWDESILFLKQLNYLFPSSNRSRMGICCSWWETI